jgi:hypothetical protein
MGDEAVLAYPFVQVEPTSTRVVPIILLEYFPKTVICWR